MPWTGCLAGTGMSGLTEDFDVLTVEFEKALQFTEYPGAMIFTLILQTVGRCHKEGSCLGDYVV